MTERTREKLTLLMAKVNFDRSMAAEERTYQELKEDYDKACQRLCGKLDDRRLEQFQAVMRLRDQIEFEHTLYYLWQGLVQGTSVADKIERPGKSLTLC